MDKNWTKMTGFLQKNQVFYRKISVFARFCVTKKVEKCDFLLFSVNFGNFEYFG